MSALLERQRRIAAALTGGAPVAEMPWRVHRNTIWHGLIAVMGDAYPATRVLTGDAWFRGAAGAFIAHHWPTSAALKTYGAGFADFLAAEAPESMPAWVPDLARLERAWLEAYHAPDADHHPGAPSGLEAARHLAPEALLERSVRIHPSLRLLALDHAVAPLRAAALAAEEPGDLHLPPGRSHLVIVRPGIDVAIETLAPDAFAILADLAQGASLGAAMAAAPETGADLLTRGLGQGWFIGLREAITATR